MLYISALLYGILGSIHCVGMCGPLAMAVPSRLSLWGKITYYQIGRLTSYTFLGLLIGTLGFIFQNQGFQNSLSILAGSILIGMVVIPFIVQLINRNYSFSLKLPFPTKFKSYFSRLINTQSPWAPLGFGILNGLLPCGLVYYALTGALATGSSWQGALYMFLFGLGSIPALSAVMIMKNKFLQNQTSTLLKLIPIITIILGILLILRGLSLGIPYVSPSKMNATTSEQTCH
jgi:sulfite exporter TauE/SafE